MVLIDIKTLIKLHIVSMTDFLTFFEEKPS
jgi:hypothetical protein